MANLHENEHEHVQRDEVDDEHVAPPSAHHVHVAERTERTPHDAACFDRLEPQVIGEHEREYGYALVIIRTGHWTRDIARNCSCKTWTQHRMIETWRFRLFLNMHGYQWQWNTLQIGQRLRSRALSLGDRLQSPWGLRKEVRERRRFLEYAPECAMRSATNELTLHIKMWLY